MSDDSPHDSDESAWWLGETSVAPRSNVRRTQPKRISVEPRSVTPKSTESDDLRARMQQGLEVLQRGGTFENRLYQQAFEASLKAGRNVGLRIGKFRLRRLLGRGGMSVVYEAMDCQLNRLVALKVLQPDFRHRRTRERLTREGCALASMTHPNIAQVYEYGEVDGDFYLAIERIDGRTFADWLAERPRTWYEVVAVMRQAGEGLAAGHQRGFVHRDFKPSNLLVCNANDQAKIIDYGLVYFLPEFELDFRTLTMKGARVGTQYYMSPEQLRGDPIDVRSDVFSFCVVLYEALYGRHPFARSERTCFEDIRGGELLDPPLVTEVPTHIGQALRRGLAREPDQRWQSMSELLVHLDTLDDLATRKFIPPAHHAATDIETHEFPAGRLREYQETRTLVRVPTPRSVKQELPDSGVYKQLVAQPDCPQLFRLKSTESGQERLSECRLGLLTLEQRLEIFREVCRGVAFAHNHQIFVHAIRPDCIALDPDGVPRLLAVQSLKRSDDEQGSLDVHRSAIYSAPEVRNGAPTTVRSEVFSLGRLLAYMLGPPITEVDAQPPPSGLVKVVKRASDHDPAKRYPSAANLSDALDRINIHAGRSYPELLREHASLVAVVLMALLMLVQCSLR